jgi:L-lactate dehydrogenase complex protein LldG
MNSIRTHLASSAPFEDRTKGIKTDRVKGMKTDPVMTRAIDADLGVAPLGAPCKSPSATAVSSVVEEFKRNLEAVDGHCIVVRDDAEVVEVVKRIAKGKGIAVSNARRLKELIGVAELTSSGVAEVTPSGVAELTSPGVAEVTPSASRLFQIDVGVTMAQAGIAETGTLVLDSSVEQNRLISLVPPVHIAILDASHIYETLGETLAMLQSTKELSPAITFITGPSRTADIELTLAIGVHGPQELYVIIIDN